MLRKKEEKEEVYPDRRYCEGSRLIVKAVDVIDVVIGGGIVITWISVHNTHLKSHVQVAKEEKQQLASESLAALQGEQGQTCMN